MSLAVLFIVPFIGTLLGSAAVCAFHQGIGEKTGKAISGFAGGVMIAAAVWSLLLPAIDESSYFTAAAGFLAGIAFLLVLDLIVPHIHATAEKAEGRSSGLSRSSLLMLAVTLGACLGNTVGFHTGRWLGNKIYDGSIRWINAEKLSKTQIFYERHGGKTIVLARFVPIVRAFAPLVAGAARMSMARFELYSGLGALIWAVSLIGVGYLFGNIPIVKDNLSMILLLGVVCAAMGPVVVAIGWKYVHQLADKMRREKNDKIEKAMNVNTQTARERK